MVRFNPLLRHLFLVGLSDFRYVGSTTEQYCKSRIVRRVGQNAELLPDLCPAKIQYEVIEKG